MVTEQIHIFRMALFFMIAGFFGRLLHQRLGTAGLIRNRLRRIALPLLVAMVIVLPLTIAPIVWAAMQIGAKGGPPAMATPPFGGPPVPLAHLWFLYLLLLLYGITLLLRSLAASVLSGSRRAALGRAAASVVSGRLAPLLLALPVAAALVSSEWWFVWMGIPAPAVGLGPNIPALLTYGAAFLLGWLIHREQQILRRMAADWMLYLAVAVAASAAAWLLAGDGIHFRLEQPRAFERTAFAVSYALALWCWCFGCIGAAVKFMHRPSARWRYLADASYWMYLVHLPVIWLLQAWTLRWPFHWSVKFGFTVILATVLLLASYRWLVRGTFVGQFLNGRRYTGPGPGTITPAPRTSPG